MQPAVHGRRGRSAVQVGAAAADTSGVTTSAVDQVLVGPLRPDARRAGLLSRLELLPERFRLVLSGCYLQGRPLDELAEACRLTHGELVQLRADALLALGRTRGSTPVRERLVTPYR